MKSLKSRVTLVEDAILKLWAKVSSGITVTVTAFNEPLKFIRNGALSDVVEDTTTPANNVPLPVKLTGTTGDINITAGDLNVQLSHIGTNYDSTRIGDGADLLGINSDGSINIVASSVQQVPTKNTVTTSGIVISGVTSVTFITSSNFIGTILGDIAQANGIYTYTAKMNNTLAQLSYTVNTGSMEIMEVR